METEALTEPVDGIRCHLILKDKERKAVKRRRLAAKPRVKHEMTEWCQKTPIYKTDNSFVHTTQNVPSVFLTLHSWWEQTARLPAGVRSASKLYPLPAAHRTKNRTEATVLSVVAGAFLGVAKWQQRLWDEIPNLCLLPLCCCNTANFLTIGKIKDYFILSCKINMLVV